MDINLKFMDSLVNKLGIKTSCGIEKYNKLKMNKTFLVNFVFIGLIFLQY